MAVRKQLLFLFYIVDARQEQLGITMRIKEMDLLLLGLVVLFFLLSAALVRLCEALLGGQS